MTKKEQRKAVFNKYGGRCAYCGCEITENNFVEDHIKPLYRNSKPHEYLNRKGDDCLENRNPSCRSCNTRKNVLTIEKFRAEISKQVERLKRDSNQFNLALRYGLIKETNEPVIFYFEKHEAIL